MTKEQFIIEQIAPYFKDPSTCGYNGEICVYKTKDGRQCVFGKNLVQYNPIYEEVTAYELLNQFGFEILKSEVREILDITEWLKLQEVHDHIGCGRISEAYEQLDYSFNISQKKIQIENERNN